MALKFSLSDRINGKWKIKKEPRHETMVSMMMWGQAVAEVPPYRDEFSTPKVQLGLARGSRPLAEWKYVAPP